MFGVKRGTPRRMRQETFRPNKFATDERGRNRRIVSHFRRTTSVRTTAAGRWRDVIHSCWRTTKKQRLGLMLWPQLLGRRGGDFGGNRESASNRRGADDATAYPWQPRIRKISAAQLGNAINCVRGQLGKHEKIAAPMEEIFRS